MLVPLQVVPVSPKRQVGTDGVDRNKGNGEYHEGQLGKRAQIIVGDAVDSWKKVRNSAFAGEECVPTIGFFPTVDVCEYAAGEFRAQGISADVVSYLDSGMTDWVNEDGTRERVTMQQFKIRSHKRRDFEVLLCPAVLGRGYDDPGLRILIDAYPLTASLITLIQRYGRVIRAFLGKDTGIVIDHAGNIKRLGNRLAKFWARGVDKLPTPKTRKEEMEEEEEEEELQPDEEQEEGFGADIEVVPGELEQSWVLDPDMIRRHATAVEEAHAEKARREYILAPKDMTRDQVWHEVCGALEMKTYLAGRARLRAANGAYKSLTGSWRKDKSWKSAQPRQLIVKAVDHNYGVWQAERAAEQARREEAYANRWK